MLIFRWLAQGLGLGLLPKAPGTFGTLLAFPLYYCISYLPLPWAWIVLLFLFIIGIKICSIAETQLEKDHPSIVWDELVCFTAVLLFFSPISWVMGVFLFFLFRVLDIFKPFPIRYIEQHTQGGLGIMLDDLIAACITILFATFLRVFHIL